MSEQRRFPWFTLSMLFAATALSFLDRQVLSILAPAIISEFGITNIAYSHVVFAFQLSYALMSALGGQLIDRIGVKRGLALSLGVWSAASAAHAFTRNVFWLGAARFVLGAGEGGCFPAATRGATEYAPPEKRSFATGFAIGGSALGAVVAPPLTVLLSRRFGWRGAFLLTGAAGFIWVTLWTIAVRNPKPPAKTSQAVPWKRLIGDPALVEMLIARFLFDPVVYLYMFWIPQFLATERGMPIQKIGNLLWIPFLLLGISQVFSGKVTDRLVSRGRSSISSKNLMMIIAAAVTPISWAAGATPNATWAIACMSLLLFVHGIWITNYLSLLTDLFPIERNATIVGLTGMVGGFGGMLSTLVIGIVVDRFSFMPVFVVSGVLYPLSYILVRRACSSALSRPQPL